MAKLSVKVGQLSKDKDGNEVKPGQRSAGNNKSFHLVPPDYYLAIVKSVKFDGSNRWAVKGHKSTAKDGKWTHWKLTPDVVLINDNGTLINRQDIIVGAVEDGALVRPDGDTEQSPMWSSAQYFLGALGLLTTDDSGEYTLDFDPDLITNRIIKVKTAVGGYIKGETGFDPKQLHELLLEQNNGMEYSFDEIPALVDQYNEDNGYDSETKLKTKNMIVNFFAVDQKTLDESDFYTDPGTGAVYLNEAEYNKYLQLLDATESYQEPQF